MGCFRRTGARRRSAPRSHGQPGTPTRSTGTAITATRHRRRSSCRPRATAGIPYAAFTAAGYGDDGYRDPGYQGPAAQDAGIAGTRTVRGFVDSGQGWGQPGYPPRTATPSPATSRATGRATRRAGVRPARLRRVELRRGGQIEMAYPPTAQSAEEYHGADSHQQPWDYDQPLRYDDEEVAYQAQDGYPRERRLPERQLPQRRVPDRGLRRRPPGPGLRPGRLQRLRLLDSRHRRHWLRPVRHHRHQRLRGGRLRRAEL